MRTSIVIAAHNEGQSLWKTVASVVESSVGLDYEIVVADDASDDGSVEEMLRRFPRVRVVRHPERRGASPTKDLGARGARGGMGPELGRLGDHQDHVLRSARQPPLAASRPGRMPSETQRYKPTRIRARR